MSENDIKLKKFQSELRKHVDEQMSKWTSFVYAQKNGFYQGFEKIGIDGCRPTEKRFLRYEIEKYLSKDKTALDIGSNCGFLTIHLSTFLKHIDGVELNPYLTNIGNDTKKFLNINNVELFTSRFEDFKPTQKYDIIFSLANDDTIDGNTEFTFEEYIGKIEDLLNEEGYLMWETISPDTYDPELFKPKRTILEKKFTLLEEKMVKSEYPVNVPERRFLVFQKN